MIFFFQTEYHRYGISPIPKNKFDCISIICSNAAAVIRRGIIASYRLNNFKLFDDLGYDTGTNGSTTLTDSETKTLLTSDGLDEFNSHINVVAGAARETMLALVGK